MNGERHVEGKGANLSSEARHSKTSTLFSFTEIMTRSQLDSQEKSYDLGFRTKTITTSRSKLCFAVSIPALFTLKKAN